MIPSIRSNALGFSGVLKRAIADRQVVEAAPYAPVPPQDTPTVTVSYEGTSRSFPQGSAPLAAMMELASKMAMSQNPADREHPQHSVAARAIALQAELKVLEALAGDQPLSANIAGVHVDIRV